METVFPPATQTAAIPHIAEAHHTATTHGSDQNKKGLKIPGPGTTAKGGRQKTGVYLRLCKDFEKTWNSVIGTRSGFENALFSMPHPVLLKQPGYGIPFALENGHRKCRKKSPIDKKEVGTWPL